MIVLGLNHGELTSSAALVRDGVVVAASPEERFTRVKRTNVFPRRSVDFCLKQAGLRLEDCNYVAQGWNPGAGWRKYSPLLSGARVRREDYFYTVPDNLLNFSQRQDQDWVQMQFPEGGCLPPVYYVQHHRAHAAGAFFLSPFEEAAILTADWRGEFESASMAVGRGTDINVLQVMRIPHSLGMFYATFTELLGLRPDHDEWKVMALAAFDVDCEHERTAIMSTVRLLGDGLFELDQSYYKGALLDQPRLYTPRLVELLGGIEGSPDGEISSWHKRVARATQQVAETIGFHMLEHLHSITGLDAVALGGGFFMNSVFNGKIASSTPFKRVYVPYAPIDSGNSIGAALYVSHHVQKQPRAIRPQTSSLGASYGAGEIVTVLDRRKLAYERVADRSARIAELLASGAIVAVLSGRMEFGERALGHRSILADARCADMKDRLNAAIKYREHYRPFASSVPREDVARLFEVPEDFTCPYMEKVVMLREPYRKVIPSAVHVDGSARVQTVDRLENAAFYDVLRAFEKLTGVPIVLNTSFNVSGEPIVLSPDDALDTFFRSGLEYLFVEDFCITKRRA